MSWILCPFPESTCHWRAVQIFGLCLQIPYAATAIYNPHCSLTISLSLHSVLSTEGEEILACHTHMYIKAFEIYMWFHVDLQPQEAFKHSWHLSILEHIFFLLLFTQSHGTHHNLWHECTHTKWERVSTHVTMCFTFQYLSIQDSAFNFLLSCGYIVMYLDTVVVKQ